VIESAGAIETPNRYRNRFGQLLEHSPFCERDIQVPILKDPITSNNECLVKVKTQGGIQEYTYAHHPCDVVGGMAITSPGKLASMILNPL